MAAVSIPGPNNSFPISQASVETRTMIRDHLMLVHEILQNIQVQQEDAQPVSCNACVEFESNRNRAARPNKLSKLSCRERYEDHSSDPHAVLIRGANCTCGKAFAGETMLLCKAENIIKFFTDFKGVFSDFANINTTNQILENNRLLKIEALAHNDTDLIDILDDIDGIFKTSKLYYESAFYSRFSLYGGLCATAVYALWFPNPSSTKTKVIAGLTTLATAFLYQKKSSAETKIEFLKTSYSRLSFPKSQTLIEEIESSL
jgi:hypothetical protein